MTTELKPGWRWENFEQLRSTVVTAPTTSGWVETSAPPQRLDWSDTQQATPEPPLFIGARITDGRLHATVQRHAAQEEGGSIAASLGDIVALWDQYAPSEHMTAIHMQAKRALAGQQPMSPDMARWCAYVGGMVAHWVTSEPDAHARLGDDKFEAAIAGIIERRLWAMPKPAPQQATPEPDDDDKWRDVALRFDKHRMQALWHLQAMLQDPAKHADIVRQFLKDPTHPAVATPEPVGERWVVVRETALDVGRGNDVRTGGRPELGYALVSDAATFGSEGEAVAAIESANLPVGWVVLPLSRLLPDLEYTRPAQGVPEDVQRDAERYRFIRDANRSDCITRGISLHTMESLDEYVDAAMEDETAALAAAQAKQ